MLISFSVGNFLSISEKQSIELIPEPLKEYPEYLHVPYLYEPSFRLLKSLAIYGYNSFGKSNLIKAFKFFNHCIFNSFSFDKHESSINADFFKLKTGYEKIPSSFEIIFLIKKTKYRYRFEILDGKVVLEDLWYSESKVRENYLFTRAGGGIILSKTWVKENGSILEQSKVFTKSHHLFLSVLLSQEKVLYVDEIGSWLKRNIILTDTSEEEHLKKAVLILSQNKYRQIIQKFIKEADLGFQTIVDKIDSITQSKINYEKDFLDILFSHKLTLFELYTEHDVYDKENKWTNHVLFELLKSESSGSIKFLIVASYMTYAIKEGQLIIIDELDSQFHVSLLEALVKVFNDPKNNVMGSQLIFTIHNTFLLANKILRRDQILFADKNEFGETSFAKLHSKKNPLRPDAPIDKKYLAGDLKGTSKKLLKGTLPNLGFLDNEE